MFNTFPGSTTALLKELYPEDPIYLCDNCDIECSDGHTTHDPDHFMCCLCYRESAREFGPRDYVVNLCDLCKQRPTCEHCAEPAERLITVDDSDRSVGYHSELNVCGPCVERKRRI